MRFSKNKETEKSSIQPSWVIKYRRNFKTASIVVLAVIFVAGSAFLLFKDDKKRAAETVAAPDALAVDMPGWWYKQYFGSSVCDTDSCKTENDPDADGLTNGQEFYYHGDPTNPDSNGNGKNDGEDVERGIDPGKEGNLTFEQAASDDQIFGESLAFGEDIRVEFSKQINPNNVVIELTEADKLKTTEDQSVETAVDYVVDVSKIVGSYFTKNKAQFISEAMASNDMERLNDVKLRAAQVSAELKLVEVPTEFLLMHQYTIAFFDLLQTVIFVPSEELLNDQYNPESNYWYDSAQSFMVLIGRMETEFTRLATKFNLPT